MADNILLGLVVQGTGVPAIISATDNAGVYTLNVVTSGGDTALIFPSVVQAANQNLPAPINAKSLGGGVYALVVASS